jgi:2-keto-4-pentenoate hydratase/2-oxohepta-3-ene-1,7-dioic acid hydratase in catechol pathway
MGLVSFSDGEVERQPGYLLEDRLVNLADVDSGWSKARLFNDMIALENEIWTSVVESGVAVRSVESTQLYRPVIPSKIIRLEGCYRQDLTDTGYNSRIEPDGLNEMDWPSSWAAPLSSTVGPRDSLLLPRYASDVRPGAELGLVIGEWGKNLTPDEATAAVGGVTLGGCLTIHDELPGLEGYKMFDNSMAIGPEIVPLERVEVDNLDLRVSIDGDRIAVRNTGEWRFSVGEMVSHVSKLVTLTPGDVLFTGNPFRIEESVKSGDHLRISIPEIGMIASDVTDDGTQ